MFNRPNIEEAKIIVAGNPALLRRCGNLLTIFACDPAYDAIEEHDSPEYAMGRFSKLVELYAASDGGG